MIFGLFNKKNEVDFYKKKVSEILEENRRLKKSLSIIQTKIGKGFCYEEDDPDDISYLKGCIHGLESGAIACLFIKDTGFRIVPDQKRTMEEIGNQIKRYKKRIKCLKRGKNVKDGKKTRW